MITFEDLNPCVRERIKRLEGRINKGIAYDFDKMKGIWEREIVLLRETLVFLEGLN